MLKNLYVVICSINAYILNQSCVGEHLALKHICALTSFFIIVLSVAEMM